MSTLSPMWQNHKIVGRIHTNNDTLKKVVEFHINEAHLKSGGNGTTTTSTHRSKFCRPKASSVIRSINEELFHKLPFAKETCEHFGIACNGYAVKQYCMPDSE